METTSFNIKAADILSYGSVPIVDRKVIVSEEKHYFFNGGESSNESIIIHELFSHTSNEVISDSIPFIIDSIANNIVLGHYVTYDIGLINHQLKLMGLPKLKNPTRDTLQIALKKDGVHDYSFAHKEDYTLYALSERYGMDVTHTHDALGDAYLTALLYLMLTD